VLPTPRRLAAAATAGLLLSAASVSPALAAPRATAVSLTPFAAAGGKAYTGFSNGTLEYANALNLGPDVAKVGLGQSAAGVQMPGPLSTAVVHDQLKQPVLIKSTAGKTAYGHGSGANVGLLGDISDEPFPIEETLAEATSPAPSTDGPTSLLHIPGAPVLDATVLESTAAANTTADGSCVFGKDLGYGSSQVARAEVVAPDASTAVADVDDVSISSSHTRLVKVGANNGLRSATSQFLAPVTLFKGTPAEIKVEVLGSHTIELAAQAGGAPGTATVTYGQPGASGTTPVVRLTIGPEVIDLTSQQVFGTEGFILPLGVADVTIGGQAHSLTGLEGSAPTKAANGTSASAAADFIRVTVPGRLTVPPSGHVFGTGSPFEPLNAALDPIVAGLDMVTGPLQAALSDLELEDLRVGHLEASSTVPVGGIDCSTDDTNPLDESRKDVTATNVTAGQTFNYTIRIPNRGTLPVTNVTVDDTYSAALEFVSSVPAPASHTGNVLHYTLGTLDPNEFDTIVMTFKVPTNATPGTVYHNHAVIHGTYNGQPVTFPVDVNGPTVTGTLPGACNLSGSTKYASNTHVKKGETFGYFVNVFNSGGTACKNVVVTDALISGVSFVSCTHSCTHAGQNVTWKLGTIASGQSLVLAVIVKVTASSGHLPNTAIITTTNGTGGKPHTPGPVVDGTTVPAPGVPATLAGDNSGQLPRTGMATGAAVLGGLLLLSGAVALRRRRLDAID
jgi:uncharacterized repeat protein (TIGR01451 family)/LPXTG-motif cell wall-anchored protein